MSTNPARIVYGTILIAGLLAAETANSETYPETVGAVAIALLVYWLAHSYAEFAARRLEDSEPLTVAGLVETMRHELSIVIGAGVPLLILLICWAAGTPLGTAVTASIWTSIAMILLLEVALGVRAELTGRELVAQVTLGGLLGLLVIAIKLVLH